MNLTVIGVDPGPTAGIVKLFWDNRVIHPLEIVQCNALAVPGIVDAFVRDGDPLVYIAVEKFVDGRYAGRGNAPVAGRATRDMITSLVTCYSGLQPRVSLALRSASEVKPWASDDRLHRAGLFDATKGMTHARDAARHALFCVVKLGAPDPMSRRART